MMEKIYDTIIIGGGPAGAAAAVYAGRKKLKTVLVTEDFGGQSMVSASIENWIGEMSISGFELTQKLEKHVRAQEDVEIGMPERAVSVEKGENGLFAVTTNRAVYATKTIVVASGGRHRHLDVPGEEKFKGRGVVYCSTCDAPLFRNKTVAVVGGGNSGLEAVVDLFPYAQKIYLMVRGETLKGDPLTQEEVRRSPKVEIIHSAETKEVYGDQLVEGLAYRDLKIGEEKKLSVQGVFVEIGSVPNSEFMKNMVKMNQYGEIIIDHKTGATSVQGIFAAGDVTDELYKQNNIAAGDAITALLSAYNYLLKTKQG